MNPGVQSLERLILSYHLMCGNWTSQEITVAAWEGNIFLFSHIFYLKSFAVILMLYTFLQTNINSYNAKKVFPGSSKGREGKGYDWLIKFSETELVAEGNFCYLFFGNKQGRRRSGFNYF